MAIPDFYPSALRCISFCFLTTKTYFVEHLNIERCIPCCSEQRKTNDILEVEVLSHCQTWTPPLWLMNRGGSAWGYILCTTSTLCHPNIIVLALLKASISCHILVSTTTHPPPHHHSSLQLMLFSSFSIGKRLRILQDVSMTRTKVAIALVFFPNCGHWPVKWV